MNTNLLLKLQVLMQSDQSVLSVQFDLKIWGQI